MRMQKRYLRCFAESSDGVWVAYCLDLGLGAQGDSFNEAKAKLEVQLRELARDVTVGPDREHAHYLLNRRAPLSIWARYWLLLAVSKVARALGKPLPRRRKRFVERTPEDLVLC